MVFRKHRAAQLLNYFFLLPFVLAYRPLIVRFDLSSLLWFSLGTVMIFVIIVISNRLPYVILEEQKIILHLHYYQQPEVHNLNRITLIELLSNHSCRIHSRDFKPVRISLNPGDLKRFLIILSQRDVKIKEL